MDGAYPGGSTISELQERTGARIKLSQNNDFYPGKCQACGQQPSLDVCAVLDESFRAEPLFLPFLGTTDRIVLISGELEAVTHALSLVIEHLHTNSSSRYRQSPVYPPAPVAFSPSGGVGVEHGQSSPFIDVCPPGCLVGDRAVAGESPMVTQVRLLIPKAAGGLIIGRGGASIRVGCGPAAVLPRYLIVATAAKLLTY